MLSIDRYLVLCVASFLFILESLISVHLADGACFVFIFFSVLSLKINVELMEIGLFSIFADICLQRFIGISFVSYVMIYLLTLRLQITLRNAPTREKLYYFFLMLCAMKIVVFAFILVCGGKIDFIEHLKQILYSVVLFLMYITCKKIWKNMSHAF